MVMIKEKDFLIQFSGLKLGEHQFEYRIEDEFFKFFNYEEFNSCNVLVKAVLFKKDTFMELSLSHQGTVNVPCDVTNEDFDLPINGTLDIVVKFGETFNNDDEDLLTLPQGEFQFNIMQFIYEMIALSVPYKRVHPNIATDYEKDETELDFLSDEDWETIDEGDFIDYETKTSEETDEQSSTNNETDPRWDELKKLLTDK